MPRSQVKLIGTLLNLEANDSDAEINRAVYLAGHGCDKCISCHWTAGKSLDGRFVVPNNALDPVQPGVTTIFLPLYFTILFTLLKR